ncbi:MAG: alpha/beta hydrolase [bacterium]|nr:alpha/beta hydrolase [bacterium]
MKLIVNGLATEYTDEGQGPVLLMLPGWMNDIHNFDALASRLAPSFRVVRLDLPGFGGGTEAPPSAWGVGEYASFVEAFIEKVGLSSYTLVGHSFGGRVTVKGTGEGILAPTSVILISSAGIAKHRTLKNRALTVLAKIGKVVLRVPPLSFWRRQLRRKLYAKLKSDYSAAGALSQVYLRTIREDLKEYAIKIRVPALLIWGSDDEIVPLADGKQFNRLISGSKLEVLPGVGHSPHRDRPEEVARLIKEFV